MLVCSHLSGKSFSFYSNVVSSQSSVELLTPSEEEERSRVRSGWVEHTWSTFIERAEDDDEELLPGRQRLSDFQQRKFRHFFYHVLDLNNDHVISEEDFTGLNSRVRHYMEWSINTAQYLILTEVSSLNDYSSGLQNPLVRPFHRSKRSTG